MKKVQKKYPLLVSLIISCVVVVASIIVLALCGMRLSTSLGGGSQFEIVIADSVDTKTHVQEIKKVLKENNIQYDSFIVEDNSQAGETATQLSQRKILVNILATNVSDEVELDLRKDIASKLHIVVDKVSGIDNMVSSIKSSEILLFGLGIGIIAICMFIFGYVRYDIFAGLSFLVAIIHNLILFLSFVILSRLPLGLVSLAGISVLTLVMLACLVSIYEKNRTENETSLDKKEEPSVRLMRVEKSAMKPYSFVLVAVVAFSALLFLVPVTNVWFSAISILASLVVTMYTTLLIAPAVYAYFLDLSKASFEARLSRNDTVNKVIKKKVARAKKASK